MKKFLIIVGILISTITYSQNRTFPKNYNGGIYYNDDMSISIGSINFTDEQIPELIKIFEKADNIYLTGKKNKIDIEKFIYKYNNYNFTFKFYQAYSFSTITLTNALEKTPYYEKIYKMDDETFVEILTTDRDNYYKKHPPTIKVDSVSIEKTSYVPKNKVDTVYVEKIVYLPSKSNSKKKGSDVIFYGSFLVMMIILRIFVSIIQNADKDEELKKFEKFQST